MSNLYGLAIEALRREVTRITTGRMTNDKVGAKKLRAAIAVLEKAGAVKEPTK